MCSADRRTVRTLFSERLRGSAGMPGTPCLRGRSSVSGSCYRVPRDTETKGRSGKGGLRLRPPPRLYQHGAARHREYGVRGACLAEAVPQAAAAAGPAALRAGSGHHVRGSAPLVTQRPIRIEAHRRPPPTRDRAAGLPSGPSCQRDDRSPAANRGARHVVPRGPRIGDRDGSIAEPHPPGPGGGCGRKDAAPRLPRLRVRPRQRGPSTFHPPPPKRPPRYRPGIVTAAGRSHARR